LLYGVQQSPMPTTRLTKSAVDNAPCGERDTFLWDDKLSGFGLKITPSGSKSFIFQYRMGGRGSKVRRYTLGKYGSLTPEGARRQAETLAHQVANGVDPQREKKAARAKAINLAFSSYVDAFREHCLEREWPSTHQQAYRLLVRYAVPHIGSTPLTDITRADIRAVVDPLLPRTATASLMFAVLRRLFSWALEREDVLRSPMEAMRAPPLPTSRDRVLSDEELKLVWNGAEKIGYPFGCWVQFLTLTGARRNEAAALDWSELDREARMWTLPANRAKNDQQAQNPLSGAAVALLDAIAAKSAPEGSWPRHGCVFSTKGEVSIKGFSKGKRRLDAEVAELAKAIDLPVPAAWRLHDLRRTLATGLQRLGTRLEVTEAVLNHASGSRSGIVGVYQRHNYLNEQRTALEAWATHVDRILSGAPAGENVVQLEARA
jgi:integrase